jgi:hypothetical protein
MRILAGYFCSTRGSPKILQSAVVFLPLYIGTNHNDVEAVMLIFYVMGQCPQLHVFSVLLQGFVCSDGGSKRYVRSRDFFRMWRRWSWKRGLDRAALTTPFSDAWCCYTKHRHDTWTLVLVLLPAAKFLFLRTF